MKLNQQSMNTQNLMGMTHQDLEQYFSVVGEKPFRATQIMKWTPQQGIYDYEQMTNLSKSLRDWLSENAQMQIPEMLSEEVSIDGTRKWLLRVDDKNAVESRMENTGVSQGFIELSNVNAIRMMTEMIEVLRGYESYQKAIKTADEANAKAINDVGKV